MVNGVGASMITKQSLAEVGIESASKSTDPNWPYLIFCFVTMNFFLYGIIACIFWGYNLNMKGAIDLRTRDESQHHTIYYDKVNEDANTEEKNICLGLCKRKVKKSNAEIFRKGLGKLLEK